MYTILLITVMMLISGMNRYVEAEGGERDLYTAFEHQLDNGISSFYKTDWDNARSIFQELQNKEVNDPRPYFFEAMVPFWQYFFADESSDAAEQFLKKSEIAIEVGKSRMRTMPQDTTTVLMMGGLYGYRGLVAASEQQYRTAVRSGASGFSYTRKLMSMSGENPDVLIGQGVFHYMMGTIPREVRWLTSMVGLSGNRETGIRMLEEAAESDTYTSTDARMILTYLYHQEELYDDALKVVEPLVEKWPENVIFRYFLAISLEKSGDAQNAAEQYRIVVDRNHPDLPSIRDRSRERLEYLTASSDY